ncbi:YaaC family protein [Flavobacterium sp. LB1P71]|uniref:YaaC family protein n=1 Tax=unclassified Flavobacterium TaxID=196869 RepID=UPI003AAAEE0D
MTDKSWNKLLEFETRDLVERYMKKRHGRSASARQIIEITSNFIQAREYFTNAKKSAISVKPLLQYYGVSALSRGLILAISPKTSEASMKPSHGLDAHNWRESLSKKKFEELTITIKNGTFYELLKATSNKSYFKNNSSGISWKIEFEIPKEGSKISFIDLIQTISDISEEYESCFEKKLSYVQLEKFKPINTSNEYIVRKNSNNENAISEIFQKKDFENLIKINDNQIIATEKIIPQFSQRFYDNFNAGIGEIVLTKAIDKNILLNTFSQFYALSFFLGMLSRYYPSDWISISRTEKGDAIYPLFIKAIDLIEKYFPLTVLEFLQGTYDFENKNSH